MTIFDELDYWLKRKNTSVRQIYERMGKSTQTYYNRLHNPNSMTLDELVVLANESEIPSDILIGYLNQKKKAQHHRPK